MQLRIRVHFILQAVDAIATLIATELVRYLPFIALYLMHFYYVLFDVHLCDASTIYATPFMCSYLFLLIFIYLSLFCLCFIFMLSPIGSYTAMTQRVFLLFHILTLPYILEPLSLPIHLGFPP
jgi:hypothetical protein